MYTIRGGKMFKPAFNFFFFFFNAEERGQSADETKTSVLL
jgi:hypothetical protein